jgi:hypothetical protein
MLPFTVPLYPSGPLNRIMQCPWQSIDWTVAAFMVFLPLLGSLWWVYARREQALMDLAQGVLRPLSAACRQGTCMHWKPLV